MEDESQPEGGAKNAPQDVMFGHHVVTLIDVLGQQSKLADWDFLPETEYDKQKFITAVKGTFGVVAQL